MVHWAFLLLAFFAGAAACYGLLWYIGGVYAQVMQAVRDAAKSARF